jgi:hypothetical protein
MKFVQLLFCLIFGLNALTAFTQTEKRPNNYRFYSLKLHSGRHFYTGTELKDKLKNGYASIEIRTGWQATGMDDWQKEHQYPSYGIGWYSGYVGDIDIFGSPHALFGFATFPVLRKKRTTIQVEPALGLTYNLKPYNIEHNAINDAIGSKFAVYFALHAGGKYQLNREMDLLYGLDVTHFSNGRTVTPNLGLNMMGFSAGFRYNYNSKQKKVDNSTHPMTLLEARPLLPKGESPRRIRSNSIAIYQAVGTVQNKDNAGTNHRYMTSSTVLEYQHAFNTKHGFSAGFDAFLDYSARDTAEFVENKEAMAVFFPAVHVGYDFQFWRLAIRLQIGANLSSVGREIKGNTFVRPAVRYLINKRLFAQLGLKTFNGATADWVEAGLGYRFYHREYRN